jgi:RNase P subunit RPR2
MEIIRKQRESMDQPIISLRVSREFKHSYIEARNIAQRYGIDITAMIEKAIHETCKTILKGDMD